MVLSTLSAPACAVNGARLLSAPACATSTYPPHGPTPPRRSVRPRGPARIVAVLQDGDGRVHVSRTRAPDLARRDLSARTGAATLLAVAVPPPGTGTTALLASLDRALAATRVGEGIYAAAPDAVARLLARTVLVGHVTAHGLELWHRLTRPVRRLGRQVRRRLTHWLTR